MASEVLVSPLFADPVFADRLAPAGVGVLTRHGRLA
jgi:hypothetical protein